MYRINLTSKTITFVLAVVFLLGMYPLQADANPDSMAIANEYIRIVVNTSKTNTGRFSVGTTGGDPDRISDQNKHLIYGGDEPWTLDTKPM